MMKLAADYKRGIETADKEKDDRGRSESTDAKLARRTYKSWVIDEWEAIQHAFGLMEQAVLPRWLRRQKLRCLFAARSRVKMQQMADEKPDHVLRIYESARPRVPWLHWQLGTITVFFRDLLFGSSLKKEQWQ